MFLSDLDQVRTVAWAKNNLWQVHFVPSPPYPFDTWFPAFDFNMNTAILTTWHPEGYHQADTEVPESTTTYTITLGFYDDENDTLLKYFTDWIDKILGTCDLGYTEIMPVKQAARMLITKRFNTRRSIVEKSPVTKSLMVIPTGAINFVGSANLALNTYSINFVVVGTA